MGTSFKVIGAVLLFLLLSQCFGYIPVAHIANINTIKCLVLILLGIIGFPKCYYFRRQIICIVFFFLTNALSCYVFRGQSILLSFLGSSLILELFFMYYFSMKNFSIVKTEQVLKILLYSFLCCYIFQLLVFPKPYFIGASVDWVINSPTPYRFIYLNGLVLSPLGIFFFLNKYLVDKNKMYLLMFFVCIVLLLVRGFRSMSVAAIVSIMYFFYKYDNKLLSFKKIMYISGCLLVVSIMINFIPFVNESVTRMIERNSTGSSLDNDDYIRVVGLNYFLHDHFHNWIEFILGSGFPNVSSNYGKYMGELVQYRLINYVDWGMIGLSWIAGIPLVLCIIWYMIVCVRAQVPKQYKYINGWFLFLLLTSFFDPEAYSKCAMLVQAILLYMVGVFNNKNNGIKHNNTNIQR